MTQPDEWTEQDTAVLGDLAYSKLEAEVERLRGIVGAARLLILLAKPAYNAPLSWDEDRIAWLDYSGQDAF